MPPCSPVSFPRKTHTHTQRKAKAHGEISGGVALPREEHNSIPKADATRNEIVAPEREGPKKRALSTQGSVPDRLSE